MSEDDEQHDETDLASAVESDELESDVNPSSGTDQSGEADQPDQVGHPDEADQAAEATTEDADVAAEAAEPADEDDGDSPVAESGDTEATTSSEAVSDTKFCTDCGASISRDAEICPECGVRQQSSGGSSSSGEKESGVSAVLSFLLPGVGQLYNGQVSRGAVVFIGWMVWEFVAFVITTLTLGIFFLIWVPVELFIHVVAAYDAYDQAEKINAGTVVVD